MEKMCKVSIRLVVLLAFVFLFPFLANAQTTSDYPNRPIQVIACYAAGGSSDLVARVLAPKMGEVLGQPVVVVNKPGASGTLGLTFVAKSKPDGYTLGIISPSNVVYAPLMQKVEYNPLNDFTYIAGVAIQPMAIVVRSDAPWKTLGELVDYVKKNPKKIKYGSWGVGGFGHVSMEMLGKAWGLDWVHIPFKGDQPNLMALLGGHIPMSVMASAFVPHAKEGKLRPLAVFQGNRMADFPQVPTLSELGLSLDLKSIMEITGFNGPKGIPPEIVRKLENAIKQAMETDEWKQLMEKVSNESKYQDSQAFTKLVYKVYPQVGEMIKELGLFQTEK